MHDGRWRAANWSVLARESIFPIAHVAYRAEGTGQPDKRAGAGGQPARGWPAIRPRFIRVVVEGSESPKMNYNAAKTQKTAAFNDQLTTTEMAEVASFVRNTWGNHSVPVSDCDVRALRSAMINEQTGACCVENWVFVAEKAPEPRWRR